MQAHIGSCYMYIIHVYMCTLSTTQPPPPPPILTHEYLQLCVKGIVELVFRSQMPSKCMVIALILIYDISSALLEPKIAMKVILDPKICEI